MDVRDLLEELDAGHPGHALVGQEQGDRRAPQLEASGGVEGGLAAVRGHDAVVRPEPAPQVALDGTQDLRIVVDREDDRLVH